MKPLFAGLLLIFTFFFNEIETSGKKLKKIKTKFTTAAAEADYKARRDSHRRIINYGTPARAIEPHAPPSQWDSFELEHCLTSLRQTGGATHDMFVNYHRERGLLIPPNDTHNLYDAGHADGSYHLPEEKGGSGSSSRGQSKEGNAQNMFVDHHREKRRPNIPSATKKSHKQGHAGGSCPLPEKYGGCSRGAHRYQNQYNVRDQYRGSGSFTDNNQPYATPPMSPLDDAHAHLDVLPPQYGLSMDQQHQAFQDYSRPSGSSPRDAHQYQNQYDVRDQSRGSGSFSDNNHPYATPPMSPPDDSHAHLDVIPPQYHLNFNLDWVPNNPSDSGGNTGGNHHF